MALKCNNGISIPSLENDECLGETKNSKCIIFSDAITYLDIAPNSTVEDIIKALVLSLKDARDRIEVLENP